MSRYPEEFRPALALEAFCLRRHCLIPSLTRDCAFVSYRIPTPVAVTHTPPPNNRSVGADKTDEPADDDFIILGCATPHRYTGRYNAESFEVAFRSKERQVFCNVA